MDKASEGGRRERKKAATRQAIGGAALELFLERGYDQVSIKEIADAADVATTTLFKHFPCKEALVFDEDHNREARLVAAVRDRPAGQGIVEALHEHVLESWLPIAADPRHAEFARLLDSTQALRDYAERMWTRHTAALSAAIADDIGVDHDNITCRALARFILEIPTLTRGQDDPRAAVEEMFHILTRGWQPPGADDQ
ncbi:TetR/AcrR family transcriptional regulator [Kibdelosporangium phytohabitans]|uniref:TetR family transcriptional regulator n=1 Tax=Kibdelosporangium phytohabitans TaxID=860235 RepID=A0A0N9I5Z6_9PSEU|nr:TetR/AcrR family transcriptional regulator [Kibdelosporangium phytohabitans]ALG10134.1 TetR family transcriptional regulator [Kibdelosporangium phytohabitans]MBE1461127.1 AcrR family transcriptional regulator [Kibdelosporangium phytohabitans]